MSVEAHRFVDRDLEMADPVTLGRHQWGSLQPLLRRAWEKTPFFREHWRKADASFDLERVTSLQEFQQRIPTVEKADFLADQQSRPPYGLRHDEALAARVGLVPILTSGTTGQGIEVHLQTPADVAQHSAVNRYYFAWAGLEPGDAIAMPMHVSLLAGGRCEYHAAVDYGLSVFPLGMYDTARRVELLQRFRPRAVIGTTSYFGHLAAVAGDQLDAMGIEILLSGAEGASNAWFRRLEASYGARIYDRYGLSQMATDHMFSCEHGVGTPDQPGTLHNIDPFVLLEVIDPETGRQVADGERGEIVLTSLYREIVPMIRCRTRDTAIYRAPGRCVCGRAFSGIEIGTVVRVDDVKKIKGINVWPQAVDDTVFRFPEIEDYRVVLTTDPDAGEVATVEFAPRQEMAADVAQGLAERLAANLRSVIGIGFAVNDVAPGTMPPSEHKARRWRDERAQFSRDG